MAQASFFSLAHPARSVALIEGGQMITYGDLAAHCDRFAAHMGPQRSLVFLSVRNDFASVVRYLACLRAGHVVHLFSDYDPARLNDLTHRYNPHFVIRRDDDDDAIVRRHGETLDLHPDVSLLLSTSGSTGTAKLVKLSTHNLQANAIAITQYLELTAHDRALLNLSFSYSYGLSILHTHLLCGASLILSEESITSDGFWTEFEDHHPTSLSGVPYSFELLERSDRLSQLACLRYITQAGGKLSPKLVARFAELGQKQGFKFFVMYGQTEAAPRLAYLPPDMAAQYPNCIGRALPGGKLWLRADNGEVITTPDTAGELVYEGPNIMMGYAENLTDLNTDDNLSCLMTGDIACRNEAGLFYITGRSRRFVKPFGIRLNLDDIEQKVRDIAPSSAVTGDDRMVLIVTDNASSTGAIRTLIPQLALSLNIPASVIHLKIIEALPRLDNGKTDYRALTSLLPVEIHSHRGLRKVISGTFVRYFIDEALNLTGFKSPNYASVQGLYGALLGKAVELTDSFRHLGGDSLSYIQVSIALESFLGHLPSDWDRLSVGQLEALRLS